MQLHKRINIKALTSPILLVGLLHLFSFVSANNVRIPNKPELKSVSGKTNVIFDLSWDNSWRMDVNYDAVWLFAKYRIKGDAQWQTVFFENAGHKVNTNNGIEASFEKGESLVGGMSENVGLYIYRKNKGVGNINWEGISLVLANSINRILSDVEIELFALEMVYIPEGEFYLGSGSTSESYYFKRTFDDTPFKITSENAILISSNEAELEALACKSNVWVSSGVEAVLNQYLPATFPKGYKAFYAMKYELSQEAYCDFLNMLIPAHQYRRSGMEVKESNAWKYIHSMSYRNSIMLIKTADNKLKFACNYYKESEDEATTNRSTDGQNIAMNYLSLADMLAYLDWSGLRPLTELEYEKMCRGTLNPVANEYSWGSTYIQTCGNPSTTTSYVATGKERPDKGNYNGSSLPIRVGSFAGKGTRREDAGAGFYGNMELTSNVAERYININYKSTHGFTGQSGDGQLNSEGDATPRLWPIESNYYIWRGGVNASYLTISDRYYNSSTSTSAGREYYSGLRGGRCAK